MGSPPVVSTQPMPAESLQPLWPVYYLWDQFRDGRSHPVGLCG
jgi:hypothetical protein